MNNFTIIRILRESSRLLKHEFDSAPLRFVEINNRNYTRAEFNELISDLTDCGKSVRILLVEQKVSKSDLAGSVSTSDTVTLVFKDVDGNLSPLLLHPGKKSISVAEINEQQTTETNFSALDINTLYADEDGKIFSFVLYSFKSLVSEYFFEGQSAPAPLSPVKRFFRLLSAERKDILYIFFYSIVIGLTSLVLPVGIQNTVQLISGGVFFSSIYILIGVVIVGVLFTGVLQVIQISLVEYLQRRVFTRAALEFAFRIPRIRMESMLNNYAPELVNRFFDVITLQKGLPKLLIDLTSSLIQIVFGLTLLSLYHPFFILFSFVLVLILILIFWITGPGGLESSINESKYKYKVAQWLEEIARALNSFKLAGNTDLPMRKTDSTVNDYLKYRKVHFRILLTQFSFIVIFKTAVIGSLLILGTILVVNREITLGQFIASEVIIILLLNAVEKVITYMDVVYDLLTAVDKIAQVTDLPLERSGGIDFPRIPISGYSVELRQVKYKYPSTQSYVLRGVDLHINAGEKICISGTGNAGKTTLTNLIAGLHSDFEGVVTINKYSLRDLDIRHLRDRIAKNISPEDLFDGTILENITLGSPTRTVDDALKAVQKVKLDDDIHRLPEGLSTRIVSGGKGLSSSFIHKLILARCLAKTPALIILNDFFSGLKKHDKLDLLQSVVNKQTPWTLIAVSNDPLIMAACDRVVMLHEGAISAQGTFQELLNNETIGNYID